MLISGWLLRKSSCTALVPMHYQFVVREAHTFLSIFLSTTERSHSLISSIMKQITAKASRFINHSFIQFNKYFSHLQYDASSILLWQTYYR